MTPTIGQRLKAKREQQRLTLEKVFEATRIRVQYLQALEADDFSIMPSPVQARGYLRNYAEYLGFNADQVLRDLHEMNAQPPNLEVIGPADTPAWSPQQEEAPDHSVVPEIEEPSLSAVAEDLPNSKELTVPVKAKPGRRKKAEAQPAPTSAESQTKRRTRKKADAQLSPALESTLPPDEVLAAPAASFPRPEHVEPPVISPESAAQPQPVDPVVEKVQPDEPLQADASDTIWQAWLNRLGSTLSARGKRRTLIPKEPPLSQPEPSAATPEMPSHVETLVPVQGTSNQIFKEIGTELCQRRELLSLHFDEVERNTHVKAHYLDALERGALDELPSTVQTRGMLSNYATFLDLDVDALLLRFADALQARHRERNPQKPARKPGQPIVTNMPPVRSFIAGDMIFGIGMAILLVGFAIWGVSRVMAIQGQREVNPTAPSISDVLLSSPDPSAVTATATFLPVEAFPGEATATLEIPTQNVNAEVQLNLVAVERTFMRVIVDGEVAFEGRVVPGNAYPFEAESQIEVLVGSGAAIRTVYNGRDLGLLGTFGQVVHNIYLSTEIMTPTGLPTLTPSITVTPTNTEPRTGTPIGTSSLAPSATAIP